MQVVGGPTQENYFSLDDEAYSISSMLCNSFHYYGGSIRKQLLMDQDRLFDLMHARNPALMKVTDDRA